MRDVAALQSDEGLTNTLVAQADQLIAQAQFEANSGHTARARELAQQALDVARESGDPLRIGHALYTAGASQFNTSSPDVPLQILFAARDCLLALEPDEAAKTLLAPTYCFIGYFYARMGLAREATEAISESFARARLLSDIVVRFKTLLTGAFAFSKQSDFDAALAGFAEAAALAQQTKNPMHLAMVESGILRTEVARLREREFIDDDPGVAEEAQKWLQRAQGVVDVDPALAGDAVVLELRFHL